MAEIVVKVEMTVIASEFKFPVQVSWDDKQTGAWWNETCAMVLEVFGLPGNRFMSHPTREYLIFYFKSEKDQFLCHTMLSDRV